MPTLYFSIDSRGIQKGAQQAERAVDRLGVSLDTLRKPGTSACRAVDAEFAAFRGRVRDVRAFTESAEDAGEVMKSVGQQASAPFLLKAVKAFSEWGGAASLAASGVGMLTDKADHADRMARQYRAMLRERRYGACAV